MARSQPPDPGLTISFPSSSQISICECCDRKSDRRGISHSDAKDGGAVEQTVDFGNVNAAIADAMVADGRMIVLTGNSVGMTNMIVLDASNQILAQFTLQVTGRKPDTVTVRRALEIQIYDCSSGLCDGSSVDLADASNGQPLAPL